MIGEYNTSRPPIILKEYGRNVQKLAEYIRSVPDKKKRTELAQTLIDLMKQLVPHSKEQPENPQRDWDDLFIVANFDLDVDSPYPIPEKDILSKKPKRMPYPKHDVNYRHYGKCIELLVKEAVKKEDPKEQEEAVIYLGKLMKTFYSAWNRDTIDDSVILKDIKAMSGGKLTLNLDKVREDNLFEKLYKERKENTFQQRPQGKRRHFKKGGHHRRRD
jgi:hypothetical protein